MTSSTSIEVENHEIMPLISRENTQGSMGGHSVEKNSCGCSKIWTAIMRVFYFIASLFPSSSGGKYSCCAKTGAQEALKDALMMPKGEEALAFVNSKMKTLDQNTELSLKNSNSLPNDSISSK